MKRVVIIICVIIALFGSYRHFNSNKEYRYTVASENYPGRHYEYYTKCKCEVIAVSNDKEVFIEYKDNAYSFYAENDVYKRGNKINITFNEAMEIVNVD